MLIELSYHLSESVPFYSSLPKPKLTQLYALEKGDVCNSYYFTTSNHAGTHVDAPRRFCANGRAITQYEISELAFTRPVVLDVPLHDDELIEPRHLEQPVSRSAQDSDFLLLRSHFGMFREDERRYVDRSPGFGAEAAAFLFDHFPQLRALAVDFMSISSPSHADAGTEAHRIFLGCGVHKHEPILLVEDAKIPDNLPPLRRVFVIPWMFEGLDSAPCTMFAEASDV